MTGIKSERRRQKPMMERKRRARINKSLEQLKDVIVDSNGGILPRLDKARILELTVDYLQKKSTKGSQNAGEERYKAGYMRCVNEVTSFLHDKVQDQQLTQIVQYLFSLSANVRHGSVNRGATTRAHQPRTGGNVSAPSERGTKTVTSHADNKMVVDTCVSENKRVVSPGEIKDIASIDESTSPSAKVITDKDSSMAVSDRLSMRSNNVRILLQKNVASSSSNTSQMLSESVSPCGNKVASMSQHHPRGSMPKPNTSAHENMDVSDTYNSRGIRTNRYGSVCSSTTSGQSSDDDGSRVLSRHLHPGGDFDSESDFSDYETISDSDEDRDHVFSIDTNSDDCPERLSSKTCSPKTKSLRQNQNQDPAFEIDTSVWRPW